MQMAGVGDIYSTTYEESVNYYLHNEALEAVSDTYSQAVLPLSETAPASTTLFNYDVNRDAYPGLVIKKGGSGYAESESTKIQDWRLGASAEELTLDGDAELTLYAAMKEFSPDKTGQLLVYLYDWDGSQALAFAKGFVSASSWSDWQPLSVDFGELAYTIPAGHQLGVVVLVYGGSDDDMWFAFDTAGQPSALSVTVE